MNPITQMNTKTARSIRWILTDIDDTMTMNGKLVPEAYATLCALKNAGLTVIAVTGRSAGWGDVHLQEWPLDAVITENGAVSYFRGSDPGICTLVHPTAVRNSAPALRRAIDAAFKAVPRSLPAPDNHLRLYDYAIDHAEYVNPPLTDTELSTIIEIFQKEGCTAKPSSIHINTWIGSFNKKEAALMLLEKLDGYIDERDRSKVLYIGDALNDEVMFEHFPNACAVANIDIWLDKMVYTPTWVSRERYGAGFAEIGEFILSERLTGEPN